MKNKFKRHLILENRLYINNLSIKIPENNLNLGWKEANMYCGKHGTGWRLPTYEECYGIIKFIRDDNEAENSFGSWIHNRNFLYDKYPFLLLPPCWTSSEVHGSDLVSLASFQVDKIFKSDFRIEDCFYSNNKLNTTARFLMVRNY
jgi:hypothetical protein